MIRKQRKYISIYFKDVILSGRKKNYITLSFDHDNKLYKKLKKMGTSKAKELLKVISYGELAEKAAQEDRTVGNYIKHTLRMLTSK